MAARKSKKYRRSKGRLGKILLFLCVAAVLAAMTVGATVFFQVEQIEVSGNQRYTQEEIVADYMTSYVNYYGIDPVADADKYNMIAEKNVMDMLHTVCGVEKGVAIDNAQIAAGAENYLLTNGMTAEAIAALKANLQ